MIPKNAKIKYICKSKRGFLPNPVDVLSMVLLGLVLVVSYFYFTSSFSLFEDSFDMQLRDTELFRTSSNVINLVYDSRFENEIANEAIKSQCRGLVPKDIREVYFIEKHCSSSNNLYRLVENEARSQLRREFREDAYLQRYMSTIRGRLGQCYEFTRVTNNRQIEGYLNMGSSVIPIPRSSSILRDGITYITLCSVTPDEQTQGTGGMMP